MIGKKSKYLFVKNCFLLLHTDKTRQEKEDKLKSVFFLIIKIPNS